MTAGVSPQAYRRWYRDIIHAVLSAASPVTEDQLRTALRPVAPPVMWHRADRLRRSLQRLVGDGTLEAARGRRGRWHYWVRGRRPVRDVFGSYA